MSKKIHTPCAIAAALTLAGVIAAPEAMALTKAERIAEAASNKADALEAQLQAVQSELSSLRAAVNAPRADGTAQKVQELDQWMQQTKSAPVKVETKDNMVFFRGGYARYDDKRGGTLDPSASGSPTAAGAIVGPINDHDAWYFGAGFDFSVNDDLFGLMDGTEVLAELMVDYREIATRQPNGLSAVFGPLNLNTQTATVNQLTLNASPKIKFMKGSAFRPWIIPVGWELSVISPPSDAITVINPGMQFGAGADYKVWKDIYVGADARWHQSLGTSDGVNTNGLTAGGYLGLGF